MFDEIWCLCGGGECRRLRGMRMLRRVRRNGVRERTGVEFREGRKGRSLADREMIKLIE